MPVFATLPAEFRRDGQLTSWAAARRGGKPIPSFLEGPYFDRDGNLYVTDIPFGRIFRVSPGGGWNLVTEYDGEPNGLKIHRDGRAFIADYRNGVLELDLKTGATRPVIERRYTERFKGVNDLFFAANGDLYFTDQGRTGHQDRRENRSPDGGWQTSVPAFLRPKPQRPRNQRRRDRPLRGDDQRKRRLAPQPHAR